ncbi:nucleotide-diphospho-sugar transferase [Kickxella alabastrina]|uniref:nucleotide-diphospho-sugar transferase n=1 Tax=Kickxella alabastrina TaxID=61397 RepID=UPI0022206731|nr:nucleotide-diphospho-sugar transferase [Kickxella alabastrina]KAI7821448.1 nucleotide-diphospho-sugar transferase [Kickxella alabastrina]
MFGIFSIHQLIISNSTIRQKLSAASSQNGSLSDNTNWAQSGNGTASDDGKLLNAALVALVRNSELNDMRSTIRQIEDRFNRNHGYPYIFLNDEDFTRMYFGKLPQEHWGLSPYVTEEKVKEALERNKDRYLYGGSFSYREMFIHKHPLLQNLDYYWRIEPGVEYFCDILYDPFKYMRDNNLIYGFTITPTESAPTVETLWKTTREWMLENPHLLPDKSFIHWVVNERAKYTLCHFWSNFEIVDLSFYRSEAYESYFQHLDRAGGFFYERWGDAPVHSMAASILLKKEQIHWFEDIGYHHPGYAHCPNKPEMNSRCVCKKDLDYMYKSMCNRRFGEVGNIYKDQALALAQMGNDRNM